MILKLFNHGIHLWIFKKRQVFSDPELVKAPEFSNAFGSVLIEKNEWDSYPEKWLIIKGAALIISCVKRAERENFSSENLLLCLHELENLQKDCINKSSNYCVYYMTNVMRTLEKHRIFVNEAINNLKKKFWEKKSEIFKDLSKFTVEGGRIVKKTNNNLICIKKEWFKSEDEYYTLQNTIIKTKVEDIKNNPQNWIIHKASGISLPWSGDASYVERKDGKEKIYKITFNQQQWKEVEKSLGKSNSFFFSIVAIVLVILLLLLTFFLHRKRRK